MLNRSLEYERRTPSFSNRTFNLAERIASALSASSTSLRSRQFLIRPDAGSANELSSHVGFLAVMDFPGHDLAGPDIEHQVQLQPAAMHARW